ncbi:hypothetical protein ACFODZ_01445 [Marinicella sediminis]|uniref:Uncharacterized protein n=1 Tax=Marinicella sediminis TaxID=1792834 RepID=A0ABV7J4P8_9GAMM|nr:hypothetical protein [Marinicella sediminis]
MKQYLTFSTLSFVLVFFLIELIMSADSGFRTYAGYNWLIHTEILSVSHILTWIAQGLVLGFAAFVYLRPEEGMAGGIQFGVITGWLFTLLVLFNMMWQVEAIDYGFFAESLLPLTGLYVLGFTISGWLFGLMFELFSPEFPSVRQLWSLA